MLVVFICLFATGTISIKTNATTGVKKTTDNEKTSENIQDNNNSNESQILESNKKIVRAIQD